MNYKVLKPIEEFDWKTGDTIDLEKSHNIFLNWQDKVIKLALLVHAGYLKEEEEYPELKCTGDKRCLFGCGNCQKIDPTLDLWTGLSEKQFKHILAKYNAEILNKFQDQYLMEKGPGCEELLFPVLEKTIESFTKQSAEEALKRLLS